jgi:dephospho-CoA kinase
VVFSDADELRRLEAITHPAIAAEISRRVTEDAGSVLVEIPLLRLELVGDWYKVAVVADEEIRIARAVARGASVADVRGRVAAQPSEDEWAEWGDFVIDNGRAWAETLLAVEAAIGVCR